MNDTSWKVEAGKQSINPQFTYLVPLARSLGIDDWPGGAELTITLDGVPCTIALHFVGREIIDACTIRVPLPPDAAQRDDQVFIDSDVRDDEFKRLLSGESQRAAARAVLANEGTITITASTLSLSYPARGNSTFFEPTTLHQAIASALSLASAGAPEGHAMGGHGAALIPLSIGVTIAAGAALTFASLKWSAGRLFPLAVFVLGGLAVQQIFRASIRRATAGDSGSGTRSQTVGFFVFVAAGLLLASVGVAANALFDDQARGADSGVITSIDVDRKSHSRIANIKWTDGATSSRALDEGRPGDRVELSFNPGAFHVHWHEVVVTTRHARLVNSRQ